MKEIKMRMEPNTYYVWVGGSCDYARKERFGGGAYIIEQNNVEECSYATSAQNTTEFRMMLTVMAHALQNLPNESTVVFVTNVSYIKQALEATTTPPDAANIDLIQNCKDSIQEHKSVTVKLVNYHKYPQLPKTHEMAHKAMCQLR
ncbi:MAG: ribonuclease H [Paludibacteraceae bacterium]|nr:ribonuclease H [Paludibacteraceae bacterium]